MVAAERTSPPASVRTRTAELWIEDGILHGRFVPAVDVSGADARENVAAALELVGGVAAPALLDLRELRSQHAQARAVYAGPEGSRVASRVALLVGSPVSRVIAGFFVRFNRPEAPTRTFDSVAAALAWLREGGR